MSRSHGSLFDRVRLGSALALPLCLLLSACGGDGSSFVGSVPPPPATPTPAPTPTPTTSLEATVTWLDRAGTKVGTYDLIGRVTLGANAPTLLTGSSTMTVAKLYDEFGYTLNASAGILPAGVSTLSLSSPEISWGSSTDPLNPQLVEGGKWLQYLGQRLVAYRVHSDGSREESQSYDFLRGYTFSSEDFGTNGHILPSFTYDVGFSYVAMGEWSWKTVDLNGATSGTGDLLFVNGDRTPPSGIPVSGTATYDAHTLSLLAPLRDSAGPGIPFTLTADFGLRTIATRIDQDYQHYLDAMGFGEPSIRGAAILGIHVGGNAPFSNSGTFDIPLTGTVNYSPTNALVTPPSEPVTGSMNGAFFGPHAEEIGGTFSLDPTGGAPPIKDAFVGRQH
jgi:hypothetical protein